MAKIGFTKLGLKANNEIQTIEFNEQTIEVKQYLPVEEKLELITNVLELSHDSNNFSNPVKVSVYTTLEIIEKYTNVNFTEKQKENPTKLYDLLVGNGFAAAVIKAIPEPEYDEILTGIKQTIKSVYKYQNSILGILDSISQDYSNLNLDADEIKKKIGDPENLALLKDIMTKLG
jgi:hypothetical protein